MLWSMTGSLNFMNPIFENCNSCAFLEIKVLIYFKIYYFSFLFSKN